MATSTAQSATRASKCAATIRTSERSSRAFLSCGALLNASANLSVFWTRWRNGPGRDPSYSMPWPPQALRAVRPSECIKILPSLVLNSGLEIFEKIDV